MTRALKKIGMSLSLLPFLFIACVSAQTIDPANLATVEGVLAELQKLADARLAGKGLVGKKPRPLEGRNVCIERLDKTADIIIIGFFAYDRGCRLDGAFIGSRYVAESDESFSRSALATLGWEKAPKAEREMLASYWVQKGLLAFFTVLQTKNKDLNDDQFHPPRAVKAENGEILVTLWIQLPSRMRREKEFKRIEYMFAKDGSQVVR